jgi:hypothetical protein
MELTETIDSLNKQLREHFGIDTDSMRPIWRIVWSEEQFEWRRGVYDDITPSGIFLRTVEEVRYVPKYRQWIQAKYVLERLVAVPELNERELPATKTSYEPIFVFEDRNGNYLPPRFDVAKIVIDTIYAAQYGTESLKKYVDPDAGTADKEEFLHKQREKIDSIVEYLWGDQSSLQGETVKASGSAVIVPSNFERIH